MTASSIHPGDLEPSRVKLRTYITRRRILRFDAAMVLGLMFTLLTVIPARLILPGTTDIGRPALVVALGMFCWWVIARMSPGLTLTGPQPIRWALVAWWFSLLLSYAVGFQRGYTGMEANSADRWLLGMAAFSGVVLGLSDGLSNWDRLRTFLKAMVWASAFMSLVGLAEAALSQPLSGYLVLPGLEEIRAAPELQVRGGSLRVASTTSHYIELSAVLATALPFAIHLARFGPTKEERRRYLIAAVLIGAGIPATISRTGIVAIGISMACLVPLWTWRMRYNVLVMCAGVFGALGAVKPSFAMTIVEMFTNISEDPSITSRTEDYELVGYYFAQRPWLGRGTGSWVVPQYIYLDNQWLSTALCQGLLGCALLAGLFLTAMVLAIIALRRATSAEDKHLCAALIGTQIIAMFVSATFDSLWFDTYAITMAVTIGLCGAVWRFTHPRRAVRTSIPDRFLRDG
ncbi:O-antigen polymerase [Virgisporangium aliadipatigenens]|uniref:O-antigen polymerase n=1 Tax=Virgisporangium aliadipatigenens TaxID=741659 RepID=A0A8J4DN68_9ACTN|nr:O-antigen ligase family protein [Virgisporangium aliadipatigenens]GIJ44560.1 O-antigen polymerase [Virgisporangium aliadipatigenens]